MKASRSDLFPGLYSVTTGGWENPHPVKQADGINGRPVWFDSHEEAVAWGAKEFNEGVPYQVHKIEFTSEATDHVALGTADDR